MPNIRSLSRATCLMKEDKSANWQRMRLLVRLLPHVYGEAGLALKGGTAINAFLRPLLRLSVDIDLTYVNFSGRNQALEDMAACLTNIREKIAAAMPDVRFVPTGKMEKLLVKQGEVTVQIETNKIVRATVFAPWEGSLCAAAQKEFSVSEYTTRLIDPAEIYAGKLVAMLARKHPRDLFDVHHLLDGQGISDRILDAFVVYLSSSNRPMHELLNPANSMAVDESKLLDLSEMIVGKQLSRDELEQAGIQARKIILERMQTRHRQFLLGMAQGTPDWILFNNENLEKLPGLQWKLLNIGKMDAKKRIHQAGLLQKILESS